METKRRIKIWHDSNASCPFEDWDCEPDLMYEGGRHNHKDFSDGNIARAICDKATTSTIIRHQNRLADILEINLEYFADHSKDEKVDGFLVEMRIANLEQLAQLCELFKIPYSQHTSNGYSQGDWADVLIVLTDDFFEKSGCNRKHSEEILKGTAKLFDQWAWGDVYGFTIEECTEYVKIPRDKFNNGDFDDPETEEIWESVDSCGGFFGDDWMTNGMTDQIEDELHEQLKNYDYKDIKY